MNNSFMDKIFQNPHLVTVFSLLVVGMGIYGSVAIKTDLFPPAQRPTVAVMVAQPGASAGDIASYVVRPLERSCQSSSGVRKVSSVSKDEVGIVTVEFEYGKGLQEAVTDVMVALDKVKSVLPADVMEPQVFKIGDFSSPVMTLAVSPGQESQLDLAVARQLADNDLKDALLNIPEVSDVEVFGGVVREIAIQVDPSRLAAMNIPLPVLMNAIRAGNRDVPDGFLLNEDSQIVIKTRGELQRSQQLGDIPIPHAGRVVHLRDVATISNTISDPTSAFHFNGQPAVAINILRHENANTVNTIKAIKSSLLQINEQFPQLNIVIADSQERIIGQSIDNLLSSLFSTIAITVLVIFLLIADLRSALVSGISIPFTYFLTFSVMLLTGMQFDIVTMTAIILALGLLVDNAIVVLENIERNYQRQGGDLRVVARESTKEIMQAVFSGTFSTIIVLVPIMFLGGYVQKVMFPLVMVLTIALLSSFVVSVTIIPLAAPFIIRHAGKDERPILKVLNRLAGYFQSAFVDRARDFFEESFDFVNRHKVIFLVGLLILLPVSMKLMAIVGRDLMPPMDTGIVKVRVETESDFTVGRAEDLMSSIETIVARQDGVLEQLSYIGGEAGLVSFGKGRTSQQIDMTINYIDRFQRDESVWELEGVLRKEIQKLPGVKYVDVTEFGATPLSSIAATVDIQLAGNDFETLDQVGKEMASELAKRPGFTSVSRSWAKDRPEYHLVFDRHECARQGLTSVDVSYQVAIASRGVPVSVMRTFNQDGVKIRFRLDTSSRKSMQRLLSIPIQTPQGHQIPLGSLAQAEKVFVPSVITRSGLSYTTNIYGLRATAPVSFLYDQRNLAVDLVDLPAGVTVSSQGEMKEMNSAFGRLGKALLVSIILLYFTFVIIFRSYLEPVVIMLSIPFAAIGGVWGLLIMDKHGCMPAFMGFILLTGVIVNNAILLIDFIKTYRQEGHTLDEAVKMAIRVRTRPILMTAITTIVGMIPIASEQAIGLERLSPLAVVAIGGLVVGTFLTLIYIPVLYILKERIIGKAGA